MFELYYNQRIKKYPNGVEYVTTFNKTVFNPLHHKKDVDYSERDNSRLPFGPDIETRLDNLKRSREAAFDIALLNNFDWFVTLPFALQAFLATCFTWGITALGASLVIFFKKINKNVMDAMLGFAAGVMIAASFWSLLSPGIEMAENLKLNSSLVAVLGFMLGGGLLFIGDKLFDKLNKKFRKNKNNSDSSNFKRSLMLIFSITLHNIPEGLAVGVAFGSLAYGLEGATLSSSLMLALGIGLQNFPEGTAVSVPLRREGYSRGKSFFYGQLSGIVEPISAVLGALLVIKVQYLLPYFLCFAAGAMIYVVVQELIPESQSNKKKNLMALFTLIGFSIMMFLDVTLG